MLTSAARRTFLRNSLASLVFCLSAPAFAETGNIGLTSVTCVLLGDSIMSDGPSGPGWATLALGSLRVRSLQRSVPGRRLQGYADAPDLLRSKIVGATHIITNLGINDLVSTGTKADDLFAMYDEVHSVIAAQGARMIQCTLLPWTRKNRPDVQASRTQVNQWIRTNPFGNGILDMDSVARDPSRPAHWRQDLGLPTRDGTHPTRPVIEAMATYARTELPAFL